MKQRRVMVVYAGWLGDLVWIVPALHALKSAFQSVSLVVSEVQAPLAGILRNGLVDEVFVDTADRRMASARAVRRAARERDIETFIDLKGRGKAAYYFPDTDAIIDNVRRIALPGDVVLVMSNGGFDNIHERLLESL